MNETVLRSPSLSPLKKLAALIQVGSLTDHSYCLFFFKYYCDLCRLHATWEKPEDKYRLKMYSRQGAIVSKPNFTGAI